jgi:uncharacterized protein
MRRREKDAQIAYALSLDGPRALHDGYRTTRQGGPSFERTFAAAKRLQAHGIPWSVLATVNRLTGRHPLEVYRFLRDEAGTRNMQFIPCVEPRAFAKMATGSLPDSERVSAGDPRVHPGHEASMVTDWSVDPDDWGSFLVAVYDEWRAHDQGNVKVNLFENLHAVRQGKPALLCSYAPICGKKSRSKATAACTPATTSSTPSTSWAGSATLANDRWPR